ncbi:hypothetical protein P7K49_029526 [Saguinus oedipus]|uniref:Uncharacterized protein n=1 Tax=Saguinus oedipus TaxID=9490 RepID=A0ABQ9U7F7_SAGOE|nr:hypothetical protein P7K49_029526 [Saguinus oedipus]
MPGQTPRESGLEAAGQRRLPAAAGWDPRPAFARARPASARMAVPHLVRTWTAVLPLGMGQWAPLSSSAPSFYPAPTAPLPSPQGLSTPPPHRPGSAPLSLVYLTAQLLSPGFSSHGSAPLSPWSPRPQLCSPLPSLPNSGSAPLSPGLVPDSALSSEPRWLSPSPSLRGAGGWRYSPLRSGPETPDLAGRRMVTAAPLPAECSQARLPPSRTPAVSFDHIRRRTPRLAGIGRGARGTDAPRPCGRWAPAPGCGAPGQSPLFARALPSCPPGPWSTVVIGSVASGVGSWARVSDEAGAQWQGSAHAGTSAYSQERWVPEEGR